MLGYTRDAAKGYGDQGLARLSGRGGVMGDTLAVF